MAKVAACLISEQIYLASLSAKRIITLLATTWNVLIMASERPLSHSSAAIVWKSLANFSWKGAREIVSLAWSHNAGSAPRLEGVKKMLAGGCTLDIMVSSFSAAPANSSSVGSSCESGLGGHHLKSSDETSALVSSSSDVDSSSPEEGSATASPAPSGSGGLPAWG